MGKYEDERSWVDNGDKTFSQMVSIQNRPLDKVLKRTFTLNSATINDSHTITDFEKYKEVTVDFSGGTGTARASVQGDLSSDQSGVFSGDLAMFDEAGATLNAGGVISVPVGSFHRSQLVYTALKIYVSTIDTGTLTFTVTGRGLAQ